MTKPSRSFPRPLSELLGSTLSDILKAQGFASTEIISRWPDIVGQQMPRTGGPFLTDGQVLIIKRWIAIGAPRN